MNSLILSLTVKVFDPRIPLSVWRCVNVLEFSTTIVWDYWFPKGGYFFVL